MIRQSPDIRRAIKCAWCEHQVTSSNKAKLPRLVHPSHDRHRQSDADRGIQNERILTDTKLAGRHHGRRMVGERGLASRRVHLPLARACWRRPRRYSCRNSRCRSGDVDELAPAGTERLAALAWCHRPTGVALPVSLRRCRSGRRTARARSPVAPAPGVCGLPNPSFSRDASQRIHNTHQPAARHGANRRGRRTTCLSLPRRRTAGGRRTCRRRSGPGSSTLQ